MAQWIPSKAIQAIHSELLAEHGGLDGPVNKDKLSSTLARPQQLENYNNTPRSLFQFAASYGFGFAQKHCFVDGNKRIALASIDVFLILNGWELVADEVEAVIKGLTTDQQMQLKYDWRFWRRLKQAIPPDDALAEVGGVR